MNESATPLASAPDRDQSSDTTGRSGVRWRWIVGGGVLLAGIGLGLAWPEQSLPEGVSPEQYATAEATFEKAFGRSPDRADVMMLMAELAVRDEKLDVAVNCFRQVPSDHERYGSSARFQQAQILLRLNRAAEAEEGFREFLRMAKSDLSISSEHVLMARKWLTFILSVELRFEDRKPFLEYAHTTGQADVYDSEQFYFPALLIWNSSVGRARLREFLEADPHNPTLLTANARYLIGEGRLEEADKLLTNLRQQQPDRLTCVAASLQCAYEEADWDRMADLLNETPDGQASDPWLLTEMRGEFALHQQDWQQAVDHFQRLLEQDPANPVCHMGLARAYARLGQPKKRQAMQERSLLLSKIRVDLAGITSETGEVIRSVAASCQQLGFDEAAATFERHATAAAGATP